MASSSHSAGEPDDKDGQHSTGVSKTSTHAASIAPTGFRGSEDAPHAVPVAVVHPGRDWGRQGHPGVAERSSSESGSGNGGARRSLSQLGEGYSSSQSSRGDSSTQSSRDDPSFKFSQGDSSFQSGRVGSTGRSDRVQ